MNRIFLISRIVVFVAATFLIINTSKTTMAYSCSSSSSTHEAHGQTSISGSSGSCVSSSTATISSTPSFSGISIIANGHKTAINGQFITNPNSVEAASAVSAGGAQSSCSTSSSSGSGGITMTQSAISKPGSCP
jgi:hypothetical protein